MDKEGVFVTVYMFDNEEDFKKHMKAHIGNNNRKKQCPVCGEYFSRLDIHSRLHKEFSELKDNEIHYCDKCPRVFTNPNTFRRHQMMHEKNKCRIYTMRS